MLDEAGVTEGGEVAAEVGDGETATEVSLTG